MDEIPIEEFTRQRLLTDVAVGPDGDRVAFVVAEFDGEGNERHQSVFVAPTDGSRDPHRLTRASDASAPTWSPDGSRLGVVAAREEDLARTVAESDEEDEEGGGDGNGEPKPQVWAFDLDLGGDPRQLTDRDEGVTAFDWGPESERIVFASRDPTDEQEAYLEARREGDNPVETERLRHKFVGADYLDTVRTYLFVTGVDDDEPERLDDAYAEDVGSSLRGMSPAWSPEGDRIAFVAYHGEDMDDTGETDLFTIRPDGEGVTNVTRGGVTVMGPVWRPDGERIAFVRREPDNWYKPGRYALADPQACEYHDLTDNVDRTVGLLAAPTWLDDETLIGTIADEGWTRPVTATSEPGSATLHFEGLGRSRSLGALDADGGQVVVEVDDPEAGDDLFALDAADLDGGHDDLTRLTDVNADLRADHEWPEFTRLTCENGEGDEIEAMAYLPTDFDPEDPDPRPLVLNPHGGPMAYDEPGWSFQNGVFASRGYLVVQPNYRGSTSYGVDHCETLKGRWGTDEVVDQAACVRDLIDRGWVDPDRTFVTGFSYGGISTGYLVTQEPDLFTGAAAEHGIYDLRSAYGTDDSHTWWDSDYGVPWENVEDYVDASAITDVGNVETPLLITAGGRDWRCPPSQAEQFYVSVRKQGVPSRLVLYEEEHHAIGKPERAIHRLEELTAWFGRFDPEAADDEYDDPHGRREDDDESED